MSTDLGERLRSVRKRSGLTQRELAQSSGVSLSLIRKIEQGERDDTRIQTLRRLAVAMGCPLSALLGPTPGRPETEGGELWLPTRRALVSIADGHAAETPAERSMIESLVAAVKLYHDNEYEQLSRLLPHLILDGRAATPLMRSRILQLVGSVLVQTRQLQSARTALEQSLRDAESTGNVLDAASAVITLCWLLLVERQFEQVRTLAVSWADRIEPRLSVATTRELSTWGWLLLRGSAAAIRDNRPDEADDMMRLANAAAAAVNRDSGSYHQYWTTFGPATVAMKRVENAIVDDRPDLALRLARDVPPGLRPTSDNRNRHLLDVAAAHIELRSYDTAFDVLVQLSREARPWLIEQRSAKDLLGRIISRRRTLTPEMRDLADLLRLEY
ncbi:MULTISPECIES: helix-turn-helix domain-containing protein [Nocardia]|uniref:Helix-turn-helix transcriptional regulator n=1 Tax=Nocardia implantans TaxID=3108168 RepID=A0ABU6B437_9NOCA|nr:MULTISPECIES: helix-turn-helix transcriptional regulator [unclassified Nocardia]MBF6196075.1 helix-turn-helix transcriptional regulator [Nocardia beijingensis]MEA3532552.1 helix-turn-helix transcriptional regulator [Nocardia sp. CDC192]MEB3514415.1 helix-turn-helix transcriptional regulator [Nocardia sp. CDC186]